MNVGELEKLKSLIGKEIRTGGLCVSQDEYGVAHGCPIAPYSGLLIIVNYNKETRELYSVVMDCNGEIKIRNFDTRGNRWVCDISKSIFYEGQKILKVPPAVGDEKNDLYPKNLYIVAGVEEVYDAFDEFEHSNAIDPVEVKASSIEDAITKGRKILQSKIDGSRRKGGFMTHGSFSASVTKVLDLKGNVLYEKSARK